MKRGGKRLIEFILVLILAGAGYAGMTYNTLTDIREQVRVSYADIDAQLQRRSDLIPNLVQSVRGYMAFEKDILDSVLQARERLMDAEGMAELAGASDALSAALRQLNAALEGSPDLNTSETFIALQDELAGTENRIATARRDYNQAVMAYNARIKRFPELIVAGMLGFEDAAYFEAAAGSREAPDVKFE